jgi:hypothetical protein
MSIEQAAERARAATNAGTTPSVIDNAILTRAYLAELDPTPITREALLAEGFIENGVSAFEWRALCLTNRWGHWRINMNDSREYFPVQTMGTVRKLMSVFQLDHTRPASQPCESAGD